MSDVGVTVPLADEGEADALMLPPSYGRFIARGVLGRGGMGVVLRARDPELDRDVALKLLGPSRWGRTAESIGAGNLLREGQALARLAHPNVVAVYEMGRVGDETFIAMELVEGTTLRGWLQAEPRPWRQIVDTFIACGRGLAAAHAAGLVHRDFKPDNVLVGQDGRPRVSDFGLVTTGVAGKGAADTQASDELCVDGMRIGTPAYMAPEQWQGGDVDPRADQFSFCVALWEALCGERPFPGKGSVELSASVLAGVVRPPPVRPRRALEAALRRGLSVDRAARFPSMDALLDALAATTRRGRAGWLAAGGAAAAATAVLVAWMATRDRGDPCAGAAVRLDEVWPAARARVAAAFATSGSPRSAAELARVGQALDGYAARWTHQSVDACRASGDAAAPSPLRDKRAVCLERGRATLGQVVGVLAGADRAVVERALDAVGRLPDPAECSDLERLDATVALPADPALRARLAAVEADLAEVESARLRGDAAGAEARSQAAVTAARAIGHPPALAHALNVLGEVLRERDDLDGAERAYREAASAAADGHDDLAAAHAWTQVLYAVAEKREHLDTATALEPVADAAVRRAGEPPALRHKFLIAAGTLAGRREDFAASRARFETAARLAGDDAARRSEALHNLALTIYRADGPAKALDAATEAAALVEKARGAEHPEAAEAHYLLGSLTSFAGRPAEALPILMKALAIRRSAFGDASAPVAATLEALGNVASNLRDYGASRAFFEEALAIHRKTGAPKLAVAMTLSALSIMLADTESPSDALPYFGEAIPLLAEAVGEDSMDYLMVEVSYADLLRKLGRCAEVPPILKRVDGPLARHPHIYPQALLLSGQCARTTHPDEAATIYAKALDLCGAADCDPDILATLRFELGTLLFDNIEERKRGRALVDQAYVDLRALDPEAPRVTAVAAWLAAHPF